jgi:two-component system sensor histidine kinase UhpB
MPVPLRVLIVEDSDDDAKLILRELKKGGYDPASERVWTADAMDAALARGAWDIILSDYVMPQFSAPAALAVLTANGLDIPFVVVSGAIGEETAVSAMRAGAKDFVMKGDLTRLVPAVTRELADARIRAERRLAQDALKDSEERYRRLIEHSPDGVMVTEDQVIVFVNLAGASTLGAPAPGLLLGRRIADLVDAAPREASQKRIDQLLSGKRSAQQVEVRLRRLDGRSIFAELSAANVSYKGKQSTQIVFRDITLRKEAEGKIREYEHQLRSLASELTLTEERQRRRIAHVLHDSVGQVLALSKIKVSDAMSRNAPEDCVERLAEVKKFLEEAIRVTRSLTFDLSSPVLYELGLGPALEELAEASGKGSAVTVRFADDGRPKPVSQDLQILLYQGSRELLVNVMKHAGARNAFISFGRDSDTVHVSVEDDGVGFDVSRTSTRVRDRAGLGLFGIRERLKHFGGEVEIRSEPGRGTRVTMVVPIAAEVAPSNYSSS